MERIDSRTDEDQGSRGRDQRRSGKSRKTEGGRRRSAREDKGKSRTREKQEKKLSLRGKSKERAKGDSEGRGINRINRTTAKPDLERLTVGKDTRHKEKALKEGGLRKHIERIHQKGMDCRDGEKQPGNYVRKKLLDKREKRLGGAEWPSFQKGHREIKKGDEKERRGEG